MKHQRDRLEFQRPPDCVATPGWWASASCSRWPVMDRAVFFNLAIGYRIYWRPLQSGCSGCRCRKLDGRAAILVVARPGGTDLEASPSARPVSRLPVLPRSCARPRERPRPFTLLCDRLSTCAAHPAEPRRSCLRVDRYAPLESDRKVRISPRASQCGHRRGSLGTVVAGSRSTDRSSL